MTEREKSNVEDSRRYCFARDGWICQHCGGSILQHGTPQLGHRIPQNTRNLNRYGKRVIHHPDNLASTCSLRCNAAVSIGGSPRAIAALVESINAIASLVESINAKIATTNVGANHITTANTEES